MKRLLILVLFSGFASGAMAQERLIREDSLEFRRSEIRALNPSPERIRTLQRARELGIPVRREFSDGRVRVIRGINPNGKPEYLTTLNLYAAKTLSTDLVWKDGVGGLDLSGEGLVVGVWDAGILLSTHREFGDRARIMNEDAELSGHGTHVSGTIGAFGLDTAARGMANEVFLEAYDWDDDLQEMDAAAGQGLLLSNHSYGYILGFDYNSEEQRWQWWGDTEISEDEDYLFGYYHNEARSYDRMAFENPNYLIVKSAGNDRGEGPGPGAEHYVWDQGEWVSSTAVRQIDGGEDGYGSIGPVATAKNIMVVGAVNDLRDGPEDPEAVEITRYSVFGPTDDGRIKPDIVANGEVLYSTYTGSDSAYRRLSGTSMSAPNASGSMALLQEHSNNIRGTYLRAASLKGVVLHTAVDAGNPGPDYIHGWGLMNTSRAAELIGDTLRSVITEQELENDEQIKISFYSDGSTPVKATLSWTDPAGKVPAQSLNPRDRILVNDLDIRVTREVDQHEYKPFVLNPLMPTQAAGKGDNVLDNVEQVLIDAPAKGFYEIIVSHKGSLEGGSQSFSLILSGLTKHFYASGLYHLSDNNGAFILTSDSLYKPNTEAAWLIKPENGMPVSLGFHFLETEEGQDLVRIYDGSDDQAPLLAEFSGLLVNTDTLLTGTGESMYVTFSSDPDIQGRGFEAIYCTTPPEGDFKLEGESYSCVGQEETYLARGQEGTRYQWKPPEGWDLLDAVENYAILLTGSESGELEFIPYNRCGVSATNTDSLQSLSAPPEINNYSGDSLLCSGELGYLMVDNLPGASYDWMLPPAWMGSSEFNEITFSPALNQGEVRVSPSNSCGRGDTLIIPTVVRSSPGERPILSLSDILCQNSLENFYVNAEKDVDYLWSVEPDWFIAGSDRGDSVKIALSGNPGTVRVQASNVCGVQSSQRFFTLTDQPDFPLLMESGSAYDDLRKLEVQNASSYTLIQWYRDGVMIDSPVATGPSYVVYVPGVYSVGVTSREGCSLVQEVDDGFDTSAPDFRYSVHAGSNGSFIIQNTSNAAATVNVYDLSGKLQLIRVVGPGRSEIFSPLSGVQLISVFGEGNPQVFRIFLP